MVEMEWTVAEEGKEDRGGAGVVVGLYVPAYRKARGHSKTSLPGCMRVRVSSVPRYKELMVLAVIRLRLVSNVSSSDQRLSTFSRGIWTAR